MRNYVKHNTSALTSYILAGDNRCEPLVPLEKISKENEYKDKECTDNSDSASDKSFEEKVDRLEEKLLSCRNEKRESLTVEEKLVIIYYSKKHGTIKTGELFNISRWMINKYIRNFRKEGMRGLCPSKVELTEEEEKRVLSEWIEGRDTLPELKLKYGIGKKYALRRCKELGVISNAIIHSKEEKEKIVQYAKENGREEAINHYAIDNITLDLYSTNTSNKRRSPDNKRYSDKSSEENIEDVGISLKRFIPLIHSLLSRIHARMMEHTQNNISNTNIINNTNNTNTLHTPYNQSQHPISMINGYSNSNSNMNMNMNKELISKESRKYYMSSLFTTLPFIKSLHKLVKKKEKLALIDLSNYGLLEEITLCFKIDNQTILNWATKYSELGIEGLDTGIKYREDSEYININLNINNNLEYSRLEREYGVRVLFLELIILVSKNIKNINPLPLISKAPQLLLGVSFPQHIVQLQEKLWNRQILTEKEKLTLVEYCKSTENLPFPIPFTHLPIYLNLSHSKLKYWYKKYITDKKHITEEDSQIPLIPQIHNVNKMEEIPTIDTNNNNNNNKKNKDKYKIEDMRRMAIESGEEGCERIISKYGITANALNYWRTKWGITGGKRKYIKTKKPTRQPNLTEYNRKYLHKYTHTNKIQIQKLSSILQYLETFNQEEFNMNINLDIDINTQQ